MIPGIWVFVIGLCDANEGRACDLHSCANGVAGDENGKNLFWWDRGVLGANAVDEDT